MQEHFTVELLKVQAATAALRAKIRWPTKVAIPYEEIAVHSAVEELCELCFNIEETGR